MKVLIHKNSQTPLKVISTDSEEVELRSTSCTGAMWELARKYPEEIIGWSDESFEDQLMLQDWEKIFEHDLIMASYAVNSTFLPESIGYVDLLPFVNVNREVQFPTWLMSHDVGGIKGEVFLQFKDILGDESDLGYLLNSVAKIGQQNGLFCYSHPGLINLSVKEKPKALASAGNLFSFVSQHYTSSWTSVLLFCFQKYEKKYPVGAYLRSFLQKKKFNTAVDLSSFKPNPGEEVPDNSIDVIIPTLDRKDYLRQVLEDLSAQTLLPKNVIVVEQNPEEGSSSGLEDIISKEWPFKIIHVFIHKTGACKARNLALDEVESEWIFFADDDIRLEKDLLEKVIKESARYGISALNLNCRQSHEKTVFSKVKQWGSFGAGTSVVKTSFAKQCRFSEIFEYGFGEDADFGMQLRNNGCDIIYHPHLETLHLKAPVGGFRTKPVLPWEQGEVLPKPSPTLMAYAIKHYSQEQINGYKVSLALKFYNRQKIRNPLKYINDMRRRWKLSERWARKILTENSQRGSCPAHDD
ncbi:glycosyltransferase family 2 protein [Salinimicrobium sediminilitoris]|uniref:glycosyltransferase family 2 protein n=1 Tax=Salinimicrobium sediminilitoris TaxID=2876715 RepID=UPI001E48A48E|nr:glycosyltransferase family A protein [Salinimicrobium sediminilitoris]MCC8358538.1 glycosyltransferase family 2 protein [Salinimicrobium sediminilitoris]